MPITSLDIVNIPAFGSVQTIGTIPDIQIYNPIDDTCKTIFLSITSNYRSFVSEKYVVPAVNTTGIKLRDILKYVFDFYPPNIDVLNSNQVSSNIKDIELTITVQEDNQSLYTTFYIINNRLENLDEDEFLRCSFLSMQPRVKAIDLGDIEFLSCYTIPDGQGRDLMCTASGSNGSKTLIFTRLIGGLEVVAISFPRLQGRFASIGLQNVGSYSFYCEYSEENSQTFIINKAMSSDTDLFYFENSAGGFDAIRATGKVKDKNQYKLSLIKRDSVLFDYNVENTEVVSANSGYLISNEDRAFFRDFIESKNRYVRRDGALCRIALVEATAENARKEISDFSFDYKYSETPPTRSSRISEFSSFYKEGSLNLGVASQIPGQDWFYYNFFKGNTPFSFKNASNYEYKFPDKLFEVLSISGGIDTGVNFIGKQGTGVDVNPAQKAVSGFLTVTNKITNDEGFVMIIVPGNEMTGFSEPTCQWPRAQETYSPRFKSFYGAYSFPSYENYEIRISDSLDQYIVVTGKDESFFDLDRTGTQGMAPASGYVTLTVKSTSEVHYLNIILL